MPTLFIDFETAQTPALTLRKMTLRKYLEKTRVLGMAMAVDDGPVTYHAADELEAVRPVLQAIAEDPEGVVVAHNAAFDLRVWRDLCGLPWPRTAYCTLELACAAFPGQAGGYSLRNLARTLTLGGEKLEINLYQATRGGMYAELAAYCSRDTELCRNLYRLCVPRLCPEELAIARMCMDVRELHFEIRPDAVATSLADFSTIAKTAASEAIEALGDDGQEAFGFDGDDVRSVKPHTFKDLLRENLGFATESISFKKLNPEKLRANADAAKALKAAETANKALSHKRRVKVFAGVERIDVELGYFRAHTGRFSSPQPGCRGINLHNLAKRNKAVAKAIRSIFRFPDGWCAVRADLANVEYRVEGLLTGCLHTERLFSGDLLADPYLGFGNTATGKQFTKADPIRQVFKAAVLGLGYLMSFPRFIEELLKSLADPTFGVTVADLEKVVVDQGWGAPNTGYFKGAVTKTRAPLAVAIVAHHMRELFHRMHPEFSMLARWLEGTVGRVYSALDPEATLAQCYQQANAPSREMIDVQWAGGVFGAGTKSLRVRCGKWYQPTVTWRDLQMRETEYGVQLCCLHHAKGWRPLTKNVMLENIVQSAARNAMCEAQLRLRDMGYPYQLTVHDELMLIVPRRPEAVLQAREDILRVLGPGNDLGWGWSILVNPAEINVSQTLYEQDMDKLAKGWWGLLPTQPELLDNLP